MRKIFCRFNGECTREDEKNASDNQKSKTNYTREIISTGVIKKDRNKRQQYMV